MFLVRPCNFHANPETAESNAFQAERPWNDTDASNRIAQAQFDTCVGILERAGVECIVFEDTAEPHTPDSIFPNNWISTHADGTVVLYPMEAPSRRGERRLDILDALRETHAFVIEEIVDLSPHEEAGHFLEGTGSLVLDRVNHVAFACRSSRTHEVLLDAFAARMAYTPVLVDGVDAHGQPIYHTNVMMWLGTTMAGVCMAALGYEDRALMMNRLAASGHELLDLSFEQLEAFAGNMLELRDGAGNPVMAMSQQAFDSLTPAQRRRLEAHASLAVCPIDHIERQSGGSVRCMLAEVHLPRRDVAG